MDKVIKALKNKKWELHLETQLIISGIPHVKEYKFMKDRRFRFDFAIPELLIGIEVEGGTWGGKSRHTTGTGYRDDCIKYNLAAICGWHVLRGTSDMITDGIFINQIIEIYEKKNNK